MELLKKISKEEFKKRLMENVKRVSRKTIQTASAEQICKAAASTVKDIVMDRWIDTHEIYEKNDVKVIYYLSMEFLMGRFLGNALVNVAMYDDVREILEELGIDFNLMEDMEKDPGLGNGGLGRLAAC